MLKWILLYLLAAVIAYFILAIFVEDEPDNARMSNWLVALLWGVLAPVALVFAISWRLTIGSRKLSNKIYNYFHKEDI